jgi:CRISPR-associated endonuclease/helicase Cas3
MTASSTTIAPAHAPARALARVFPYPSAAEGDPDGLICLDLKNHVTHVTELVRKWDNTRAYGAVAMPLGLDRTKDRLVRAARRHDEGKPQTFRLSTQYDGRTKRRILAYSFRGHRFLVIDDDPYVDWLIRLHHEYDVATITEAQADLRRRFPNDGEGEMLARCFPYDLYTLEMCDQIDAEASTCALSPDTNDRDRERAFMEYHASFDKGAGTLTLDPWPFAPDSIALAYPSFTVDATADCHREWENARSTTRLHVWEELAKRGLPTTKRPAVVLTLHPEKGADRDDGGAGRTFYGGAAENMHPNPMQEQTLALLKDPDADGFLLLKAPTGSGKTEAVLAPALEAGRRLFLILPSHALVEDQRGRLARYLAQASRTSGRVSLIVDTGDQSERLVWVNGQRWDDGRHRHLYDADVVVTTLDSFLFRFFAFGAGNKSYIFPLRIQLRRGGRPPLFCFDEAHSYDTLAWQNFLGLIEALACDMALDVVVMSATIPRQAQDAVQTLGAHVLDYTGGAGLDALRADQRTHGGGRPHPDTTLFYHRCPKEAEIDTLAGLALQHWRPGRRVIVAVESVRDAVALHDLLAKNLYGRGAGAEQALVLYHGRLDTHDRRTRYAAIAARDRDTAGPGYLLVTTSAIEVGCDLDAHTLLTTLCYPEQLVQRAGRCNRRAMHPDAALHVVGNALAPHASSLSPAVREALQAKLIAVLEEQKGGAFRAAGIVDVIVPDLTGDDRAEVLFSLLSDYVYEGDRTAKPAHDKGLVLTRSWEPSVTLYEDDGKGGQRHAVQVPLSRCFLKPGEDTPPSAELERAYYDEEKRKMVRERLRFGGCCYLHRLTAKVPSGSYHEVNGYAAVPRFLRPTRATGYRAGVWYEYPASGTATEQQEADDAQTASGDAGKDARKVFLWYLRALPSTAALGAAASDVRAEGEEPPDSADDGESAADDGENGGEE